jgi:hypothetical protein
VELYLHSPNTPSWRGAQFKKTRGTNLPSLYVQIRHEFIPTETDRDRIRIIPVLLSEHDAMKRYRGVVA